MWRSKTILVKSAIAAIVSATMLHAGDISGRRENLFGTGQHETFIYLQGLGANSTSAHDIGFSWFGNYTLSGLPAGQYYLVGGETTAYPYLILNTPITVPASGTLNLDLDDHITMDSQGLGDLDSCQWVAQTFVATGRELAQFAVISPSGGSVVNATIREGGPFGPQIGPTETITNGSLFPALPRFAPGEVPLVPGRTYALRLDGIQPWRMAISFRPNPFPNGEAWIDGERLPETDLAVSIQCRDNGFIDGYRVTNWWRPDTFSEYVQTFTAGGTALRVASMMVAGPGGSHLMRASVHEWNGNYPYGAQIGPTKTAEMGENVFHAFIWGPNEVPLTPGTRYAVRYARVDGQPIAIYGDTDRVSGEQAYFDGVPDGGIDMAGRLVYEEEDRGDIAISNLQFTPISATQVRATFTTDVPSHATVVYRQGSPVFDTIQPAADVASTQHDIVVDHLIAGTTYAMHVLATNADRNVTETTPVNVTLPVSTANISGIAGGQRGAIAGADITLLELGASTTTASDGSFAFNNVPTGKHTLRLQSVAQESVEQEIEVAPGGSTDLGVITTTYTPVYEMSQSNPLSGWTTFGYFDGQFDTGSYDVDARTGNRWIGYVTNGADTVNGIHGGAYRTVNVVPGTVYRLAGFAQTRAFGSSDDPIDGVAVARLGIDLTGGTDPDAPTVQWSRYRFTSSEWMEHGIDFTSSGAQVTIFAQHKWDYFYPYPPWFIAAFDDIWLGVPATPIPDFDNDGDVDLDDYGRLQACVAGGGVEVSDPQCRRARLDGDEDVDAADIGRFIDCLSGADLPLDPDCSPN